MPRARSRSSSLRAYWRDVRHVAMQTGRSIHQARGIVRALKADGLSPRGRSVARLERAFRADVSRRAANTRAANRAAADREQAEERAAIVSEYYDADTPTERADVLADLESFDPGVFDRDDDDREYSDELQHWIDVYDDFDDFYDDEYFDVTPDYE